MKKLFLAVGLLIATINFCLAQVVIPEYGQIHNNCLTQSMSKYKNPVAISEIADNSFDCLESSGIALEVETKSLIKEVFNSFDFSEGSKSFYEQILERYETNKSNLTDAYNLNFGLILNELTNMGNYFEETKESFDNTSSKNFEAIRATITSSQDLNAQEITQLSATIDIAIGSSIFWHDLSELEDMGSYIEKTKESFDNSNSKIFETISPAILSSEGLSADGITQLSEANDIAIGSLISSHDLQQNTESVRRWWDAVDQFVGSDVVGAGAVMQVTYSALPPQAYVAAGLACSAYTALNW